MFSLNNSQKEKLREWMESRNLGQYEGASGGRFTFSFTPTSLGVVTEVFDNLNKENNKLDLTDYNEW